MRHLQWNEQPFIDFFSDSAFASFKASKLKRLQGKGAGSCTTQAEVLTEDGEELLWAKGDSTLLSLLNAMVYCNGLYFALRSGKEHRQLRSDPCQISLVEQTGERQYVEDISKNRPGGIKGMRVLYTIM